MNFNARKTESFHNGEDPKVMEKKDTSAEDGVKYLLSSALLKI